jgi:hypothetical protein
MYDKQFFEKYAALVDVFLMVGYTTKWLVYENVNLTFGFPMITVEPL